MDTLEKTCEDKLEELVHSLLVKTFPWFSYKVPRLSYLIQPEDIPENLPAEKMPKKLTGTHFAILSYLRLQTKTKETILQKKLYQKLNWVDLSEKKFCRKVGELKKLELIAENRNSRDRRVSCLFITKKGLEILERAENKRRQYLLDLFRLINPKERKEAVEFLEIVAKLKLEFL